LPEGRSKCIKLEYRVRWGEGSTAEIKKVILDCSENNWLLQIPSSLYKNDTIGSFYARNRLPNENASLILIQGGLECIEAKIA
jgi:hypothetical protein